jgi:hypothetical protein
VRHSGVVPPTLPDDLQTHEQHLRTIDEHVGALGAAARLPRRAEQEHGP